MGRLLILTLTCTGVLFLIACNRKSTYRKHVENLISSEIHISDRLLQFANKEVPCLDSCVKMVVYFDSTTCASCELSHLWEWDEISAISKDRQGEFQTIFIFGPGKENIREVKRDIRNLCSGDILFIIDETQEFRRNNPSLPEDPIFHTLLLDKENEVILIGNPVKNKKLGALYKDTIIKLIDNR